MAVLSQLVSIPNIVIILLIIIIFFYYKNIRNLLSYRKKTINNKALYLGFPIDLLERIPNDINYDNLSLCFREYLSNLNNCNDIYNQIISKNNKIIIVLLGENSAGKTSILFSLFNVFNKISSLNNKVVISTIDFYKQAWETFYKLVNINSAKYIEFEKYKTYKSAYKSIINEFYISNNYIMLLDTSGKDFNKHNLKKETDNFILNFRAKCYEKNIKCFFAYVLNTSTTLNKNALIVMKENDFIILSHVNNYNFSLLETLSKIGKVSIFAYLLNSTSIYMFELKQFCNLFVTTFLKTI